MILQNCKINGKIDAKPSKSIFQRILALSLLSINSTTITNPSFCDDSIAALNIIKSIGCHIEISDFSITITPEILSKNIKLNCKESALAMRMFSPVLSLFPNKYILEAENTLAKRQLFDIEPTLKQLGAFVKTNNGFPPIEIKGPIKAGNIIIDGSNTSQFLTGLLIAFPNLNEVSLIEVKNLSSRPYVNITLDLIKKFGGSIEMIDGNKYVCHPSEYLGGNFYCENDWSNAAVFLIAAAIGGVCEISGLDLNSKQGDKVILDILKQIGAKVEFDKDIIKVEKSELKSFEFSAQNNPDIIPALCVLALNCDGISRIYEVERLKHKEIDRLNKIIKLFRENNIKINYKNNYLEIEGCKYSFNSIDTNGDHRFAMVAALLSINNPKPVEVINPYSVNKSYPNFWDDFLKIQEC